MNTMKQTIRLFPLLVIFSCNVMAQDFSLKNISQQKNLILSPQKSPVVASIHESNWKLTRNDVNRFINAEENIIIKNLSIARHSKLVYIIWVLLERLRMVC